MFPKIIHNKVEAINAKAIEFQKCLIERQLSIATAESCTGGFLSTFITNNPGCSRIYAGSIIAYANEVKIGVLGVREDTIKQFGAVSAEVANEMAENVAKLCHSNIGIGITGIAGPDGGTQDKPVGTVWISCFFRGHSFAKGLCLKGDRSTIRLLSVESAFDHITQVISEGK